MRRPDLLILIAIWEFIAAFLALVGISAILIFAFPMAFNNSVTGAVFGESLAILVLLCYAPLGIVGGIGLLKGQEWGRIVSIVHSALSCFSFPFGTAIGVLSIVYLTRNNVKEFFGHPAQPPPQDPAKPPV